MNESIINWCNLLLIGTGILVLLGILYYFYEHSKFSYYIYSSLAIWIILYVFTTKIRNYRKGFPEIYKRLYRYVDSQRQGSEKPRVITIKNIEGKSAAKNSGYEHINKYVLEVERAIENGESVHVNMSFDGIDTIGDVRIEGAQHNIGITVKTKLDDFERHKEGNSNYNIFNLYEIFTLDIGAKITPNHTLMIMDLHINQVYIKERFSGNIIFDNCWIVSFNIIGSNHGEIRNIKLENCLCMTLGVRAGPASAAHGLSIISSKINQILLPSGLEGKNLVQDKFLIKNSSIYNNVNGIEDKNIQHYRILQKIIQNNGDTVVERQIKASVLEMERQVERDCTFRFVGWIYDHFSGYGTKPLRTLGWMVFFTLLSIGIIYGSKTVLPAINCQNIDKILKEKDYKQNVSEYEKTICNKYSSDKTRVYSAVALGIKPMVNPLGFFQQSQTVKPKDPIVSVLLFIQWIFTVILLTLLIISIKGRFKLHD